jgi:Putative zinc-finger
MMTCQESVRLLSERRDHPLPFAKRVALRLHLAVCAICRAYDAQLSALGRICRAAGIVAPERSPGSLPDDRKQKMKEAIARAGS